MVHLMKIVAGLQKNRLQCLSTHSEAHAELMKMRSFLDQTCQRYIQKGKQYASKSALKKQLRRVLTERVGVQVPRNKEINLIWDQLLQTADYVREQRKKMKTYYRQLSYENIKLKSALTNLDRASRNLEDKARDLQTQASKSKDELAKVELQITTLSSEYLNLVKDCGFAEKTGRKRLKEATHKVGSCPLNSFPKRLQPVAAAHARKKHLKRMLAQSERDRTEIENKRKSLKRCRAEVGILPEISTPTILPGQLDTVETFYVGDRVSIPGTGPISSRMQGSIVGFKSNSIITVQQDDAVGGDAPDSKIGSQPQARKTVDIEARLVWFDWTTDKFPFPASVAETPPAQPKPAPVYVNAPAAE
uniref:Uncharacterized protein n=1 Tax=Lotharella oceanica TaxID=641309 RepID=A0A7S2XD19_9EUKA|mmetsp:Transcript_30301/g.56596  ORF Transcript_30301/g.56596 Transcript_30301/m.56596 type:complete len:361 (+) Transcript_30301:76-1158(+)